MKTAELRELGAEELKKKEKHLRHELLLARFSKVNQQLKNPLKVRQLRRDIARILTIVNEKGAR
ncbi:50S ribosomal protein L29 [candidate division WOR-1 bacterium RIFCSPLOWO2_02_FULL_46_20]|uniref:Large ribosomal subunit protein uL29 n=2 Tax=Saganbacteria TaxID=1703751 RepID=A0A1F4R504_UNCSA|nr:MAG: 50S ribosomal protein L29 [candidate division WOR-1 bacterium RIFCSPHIGHO2_02_FULL_45_12]OGC03267.1 MAG: 50S ribosomal protein L29 [candidate division WOR-1 bacterium RIFCSPLOWO2_02_FULL_46_20]OGC08913.1 MAG: 50S ribosomal protein L29 [candidate division WOR-1 bacterium RIFCSPLOWO2_12_FULL_45_9]